jgi:RNAse (barnase) inhibitor barstar
MDTPGYAIVAEDGNLLGACAQLAGFFSTPRGGRPERRTIQLLGCSARGALLDHCARGGGVDTQLANVDLQVLDHQGTPVGAYHLAAPVAGSCTPHRADPTLVDVPLTGLLWEPPHPQAEPIWTRWRAGPPPARNLWARYPSAGRAAWLQVVRLHACRPGRQRAADASPGAGFELDGHDITDVPSLYCAIGEAINGPGGYFGADLDGLSDCLSGDFGATVPFTLTWQHADVARRHLGRRPGEPDRESSYFEEVLEVLHRKSVNVVLR